MPRYFFWTEDGRCAPDEEGTELRDLAHAKREALRFMAETLPTVEEEFWRDGCYRVLVKDERGLNLFSIEVAAQDAPANRRG